MGPVVKNQIAFSANELFWTAIDWLYPPNCGGCGVFGERWCSTCAKSTAIISESSLCPICGIPQINGQICQQCRVNSPPYHATRAWAVYEGAIRKAIHSFKYKKNMGLGILFSKYLTSTLKSLNWPIDLIVPVPLNPKRMGERGYNQANLLAKPVAWAVEVPYSTRALFRTRNTRSQVGLNAHDRHSNVKGAFLAKNKIVSGRNVLLIDDITTTGSTIASCAQALIDAGAKEIYGLTLARAIVIDNKDDPMS
jgi:competence protein ComFC